LVTRDLCVLLPTINELQNIKILIPQLVKSFPNATILVVDDNSSDGTYKYIKFLQLNFPNIQIIERKSRRGIGSAHLEGMKYASKFGFDHLVTMDADLTHRVSDAILIYTELKNCDVVIGSRYLQKSNMKGWPLHRIILTHLGHLITRVFFGSKIDMSSGLRGYRIKALDLNILEKECPVNYDFFFVSVLVFKKYKLSISQVPATLNNRNYGRSKMTFILAIQGGMKVIIYAFRIVRIRK
jgi:dolichol-phosphate mannosyltransferase